MTARSLAFTDALAVRLSVAIPTREPQSVIVSDEAPERVVVYRSGDPAALDLVQGMLEGEGFAPRRLGRTSASLMGGGNSAFEQLIDVPAEHGPASRALLDAQHDAATIENLERQALSVSRAPNADTDVARPRKVPPVLYVLAALLFAWLLSQMLAR